MRKRSSFVLFVVAGFAWLAACSSEAPMAPPGGGPAANRTDLARGAVVPAPPRVPSGRRALVTAGAKTYPSRGAFDADYPGLPVEDFQTHNPVFGFVDCGSAVSANIADACFSKGDLLPGIRYSVTTSFLGLEVPPTFGIASDGITGNAFVANMNLDIDRGVCAVGLDLVNDVFSPNRSVIVTARDKDGNLLVSIPTATGPAVNGRTFIGIASTEEIRNVLVDADGFLPVIDDVAFGCDKCVVNVEDLRDAVAEMKIPGIWGAFINGLLDRIEGGDRSAVQSLRGFALTLNHLGILTGHDFQRLMTITDKCA